MKKWLSALLVLVLLPVPAMFAAAASDLESAGAAELSSLEPGKYTVYYRIAGGGSAGSYQDVSISAETNTGVLAVSCAPAVTEPLWEEKAVFLEMSQVPDILRISALVTLDGQNWEQHFWEMPFAE